MEVVIVATPGSSTNRASAGASPERRGRRVNRGVDSVGQGSGAAIMILPLLPIVASEPPTADVRKRKRGNRRSGFPASWVADRIAVVGRDSDEGRIAILWRG